MDKSTDAPWRPYSDQTDGKSMEDVYTEEGGVPQQRTRCRKAWHKSSHCWHLHKIVLLLVGIAVLLYLTLFGRPVSLRTFSPDESPVAKAPTESTADTTSTFVPGAGITDTENGASFSGTWKFKDLESFTLRNIIGQVHWNHHFENSHVKVLKAPAEQEEDILVDFKFQTSDKTLTNHIEIEKHDDSLIIKFPRPSLGPVPDNLRRVSETQTEIYVRPGLKLESLELESKLFGLEIPSALDLNVEKTNVIITVGDLIAEPFIDSRETYIHTESGAVRGTYPLYDVLDIKTQSGSITADVEPQKADKDKVRPAAFSAHTASGSIQVNYKGTAIPERDYTVDVHSHSGRVSGTYIHGTKTRIQSEVGAVDVDLIPFALSDAETTLLVNTRAGSVTVRLSESSAAADKALKGLRATIETQTGRVDVRFPRTWEGTVDATSQTGKVTVGGHDLRVIEKGGTIVGDHVRAVKGDGGGETRLYTTTGSINFYVA